MLPLSRRHGPLLALSLFFASVTSYAAPDPTASAAPDIGAARKVRLEYALESSAEKCPSADSFAHAIRARLDHDPFSSTALSLLRVTIGHAGKEYQASYEIVDEAGKVLFSKKLEDRPCAVVVDQAAFSISVIMPPLLTAPVVSSPPPAPAPPAPSAAPPGAEARPVEQAKDEALGAEEIMRGGGSLGALFNAGLLPAPAGGGSFGLHFQWKHFLLGVEGRALITPDFSVDQAHSAWAIAPMGLARICYEFNPRSWGAWALEVCPLLGVGGLLVYADAGENQPNYKNTSVNPVFSITGLRIPVVWQMGSKIPEGYLRAYLEFAMAPGWTRYTHNGQIIWGDKMPMGISIGVDAGLISGRPRAWDKPEPPKPEQKSVAQR